jgi:hypothetical protein
MQNKSSSWVLNMGCIAAGRSFKDIFIAPRGGLQNVLKKALINI